MTYFFGKICDNNFFKFTENHELNMDIMLNTLRGHNAGHIARGVIPKNVCEKVEKNFWINPLRKERPDKIPAHFIGTYHYGKSLATYFKEAEYYSPYLNALFDGTEHVIDNVIKKIRSYLNQKDIEFRLAEHQGKKASSFRISSFPQVSPYAVKPHDDIAQLDDPDQAGFEIQKVKDYDVITVNLCLDNALSVKNEENSGRFKYWNVQPNDEDRKRLGINGRGYPYPPEMLDAYDKIEFPVHKGDIFFLNGRNVHGVGTVQGEGTNRITMQFFMGFIDPKTVVYWV